MEDFRLDQSGQEVQEILNGAAMQSDLTAETERATEAEQTLQGNIDAEETRAQGAEGTLQDNIDVEETRAKAAEKQNADDIDAIEEKIPSGASSSNKLTTEEYVADAVATATATFRGTYNLVSDLHLNVNATEQQIAAALAGAISTADNNDYCFILVPTSSETPTEIKEIDRYKFNGTAWGFEYKLNNSGFTAAQWAAINSGITSGDVAKLAALPTNAQLTTLLAGLQSDIDGEEARAKAAELAIQGNIDAEETRAKAAEKQNADDIDAIEDVLPETASSENKVATESEINSLSASIEAILLLIPSAATSLNKLADKAFVNSSIATATATFRGTYNLVNDLGLTTSATHAQIATALAGAILTADNNDYAFVQIPTSDAMPTEIAKTERYKFNGTAWEYEYDLNNSGFTADQWAAINSGITQALVTKLAALPTNAELTTELGTLTSGITTINQKIPSAASQANKLVDTAAMESYIVQVLDVLTISYNVTSTDGHVTLSIEQVDGKITSVTLTTSDIASAADLNLKASQADLTALASRVTTAEGNITSIGGRMTTAEGNITSLGGRVSTNETDIANLQQLYNDLQQSKPVPVTALPSTGQQQGVIYRLAGITSYSDYMWNGSTWVLMATYNNAVDPRPKKASLNLVTSGGVFDNMGALDVSELNATENPHTLAQYVDLSAALAAIPTDYQKGGMSIKFVRSSDNKYVQFRLMANSFSTTVSNWQGIDDEPTAGSDNLVKSGGIEIRLSGTVIENYNLTNASLKLLTDFEAGDVIYYSVTEKGPALGFFDSNNNRLGYIGARGSQGAVTSKGEYTLPEGFSYAALIWGSPLLINYIKVPNSIEEEIEELREDFSNSIESVDDDIDTIQSIIGVDNTVEKVSGSNLSIADYVAIGTINSLKCLTVNYYEIRIVCAVGSGSWQTLYEGTADGEWHNFTVPSIQSGQSILVIAQGAYGGSISIISGLKKDISGKQETLVSGTNIKTINNISLLGSGNINISGGASSYNTLTNKPSINGTEINGSKGLSDFGIQETLVSGENIATINGSSVLGGGDIPLASSITNNPDNVTIEEVGNVLKLKDIAKSAGVRYGVKHIYSDVTLTTEIATSWQGCIIDIRGRVLLTGSATYRFSNCVLWFNGGYFEADISYTGYIHTNNSTYIVATPYQIFKGDPRVYSRTYVTGTPIAFIASDAYGEWFGAKGDGVTPDGWAFNLLTENVLCDNVVLLPYKTYVLERSIKLYNQNLIGASGSRESKPALIRYPKFIDVPITSAISIEAGEVHTFTVDDTNPTYADMEVGMSVSLVYNPSTSPREVYNGRFVITAINGNSVTVRGVSLSKAYEANTMCLTSGYQLVEASPDSKCYNREIRGVYIRDLLDLNPETAIYPLNRCFWEISDCVSIAGGKVQHNTRVVDCTIENAFSDAIIVGGDNIMVEHCEIKHCGSNGIHFSGAYQVHITDNFIFDTNLNPLTGHNEGAITYSNCASDVYITNNTFDCCLNGIGSISTADNCKSIITGNTFRNFRNNGIHGDASVSEYGSVTQQFIISNNRFIATQDDIDSWEVGYELIPLTPRVEASGFGINFERSNNNAKWKDVIFNGNIFIDCGVSFNTVECLNGNGNIINIEHDFTQSVPSDVVVILNCTGNGIGNMIKCNSLEKTNCFKLTDSKVVIQLNTLQLSNCTINSDANIYCTNNVSIS